MILRARTTRAPCIKSMRLFKDNTAEPPALGPLLRLARERASLSLEEAAIVSRIHPDDVRSLEGDDAARMRSARLKAVSYARSLGINPSQVRKSLPSAPVLVPQGRQFLSGTACRHKSAFVLLFEAFGFLAPMGRAILFLLITVSLVGTWGMIRQLSRVRPLPWTLANNSIHPITPP